MRRPAGDTRSSWRGVCEWEKLSVILIAIDRFTIKRQLAYSWGRARRGDSPPVKVNKSLFIGYFVSVFECATFLIGRNDAARHILKIHKPLELPDAGWLQRQNTRGSFCMRTTCAREMLGNKLKMSPHNLHAFYYLPQRRPVLHSKSNPLQRRVLRCWYLGDAGLINLKVVTFDAVSSDLLIEYWTYFRKQAFVENLPIKSLKSQSPCIKIIICNLKEWTSCGNYFFLAHTRLAFVKFSSLYVIITVQIDIVKWRKMKT